MVNNKVKKRITKDIIKIGKSIAEHRQHKTKSKTDNFKVIMYHLPKGGMSHRKVSL